MDALDGNAIAGLLRRGLRRRHDDRLGPCAHCGAAASLAESVVYLRAPGVVLRCRTCDTVLAVFVEKSGLRCVDLQGLRALRGHVG